MLALLINLVFAGVFFYIGIKGLREKKITYRKKKFMAPSETLTWTGKKAQALAWLYIAVGVMFIASPVFKIIFAPRVVY